MGVKRSRLDSAISPNADILLDTTTLIAHLEGRESISPTATRIVDEYVKTGRNRGIVPAITAMELLVKPIKHGLEANVLAFLTSTPHLIHIDINLAVAREAAKIRARLGFRTPDALIVATGIVHKVKYLVTNDGAWKKRLTHPSLPTVIMLSDFV